MGVHGMSSNNKRVAAAYRKRKQGKAMKAHRKRSKQNLPRTAEIIDPELVTPGMLKKRQTSRRTNITLSNKKRNKIMKQLKRLDKAKSHMEVDDKESRSERGKPKKGEATELKSSFKKTKKKNAKREQKESEIRDSENGAGADMECE